MERRRIGSDLHDGPSQTLAFAMLRLDAVESRVGAADAAADADLQAVQSAVGDALRDMRTIAAGLRTPELEQAGPADVLRRAMADHERRSGEAVTAELDGLPAAAPLATKIALFRIVSEALSSAARHGSGAPVTIASHATADGFLETVVTDTGPGFNVTAGAAAGHLGLAGMRERAEMLGGGFEVSSTLGTGTTVRVRLPLIEPTDEER
jgi:Signal transduction histidine kinase